MFPLAELRKLLIPILLFELCALSVSVFRSPDALAASELSMRRTKRVQVSGLSFSKDGPTLNFEGEGEQCRAFAIIEGTYTRKNWTLIVGRVKVPRDPDGHFKLKTELRSTQKNLILAAIGPDGQIEFETLKINYPGYPLDRRSSRHSFAVGVGLTRLSYQQDASSFGPATSFSEEAITVKGSYLYRLAPPRWDIGVSAFISTLTFGANIPGTSVRSLGLNARIGYNIPLPSNRWALSIMGGFYYTTMFVSPADFGFENLSGPQLFPVIRYFLPNHEALSAYLKYSPVSAGTFSLQSSSREIAGGITYSHHLSNGHSLPFSIDVSDLVSTAFANNAVSGVTESVPIKLTTVSFSVGYTF
ncbi:MAG: hypothetical protein P4M08_16160 [Oligoflexia bacterium]|nr:hypothetical protein [Oligoflexia bacterium]